MKHDRQPRILEESEKTKERHRRFRKAVIISLTVLSVQCILASSLLFILQPLYNPAFYIILIAAFHAVSMASSFAAVSLSYYGRASDSDDTYMSINIAAFSFSFLCEAVLGVIATLA